MEDAGGQFDPMPEANPMTEATANDVVQSKKNFWLSGSSDGCSIGGQLILETKAT
jgi:hypothetical protein